jgi:hypothetical protein
VWAHSWQLIPGWIVVAVLFEDGKVIPSREQEPRAISSRAYRQEREIVMGDGERAGVSLLDEQDSVRS